MDIDRTTSKRWFCCAGRRMAEDLVAAVFTAGMYQRYKNEICSTHAKIAKTQRHDVQINIGKQTLNLG